MWRVKIYVNEVGWDGEPQFEEFESEGDARAFADKLDELWTERLSQAQLNVHSLDLFVEEMPSEHPAGVDTTATAEAVYLTLFDEVAARW